MGDAIPLPGKSLPSSPMIPTASSDLSRERIEKACCISPNVAIERSNQASSHRYFRHSVGIRIHVTENDP